jgi:hypothetical protein
MTSCKWNVDHTQIALYNALSLASINVLDLNFH